MESLLLPVCMRIFGMEKSSREAGIAYAPLEQRRHLERVFSPLEQRRHLERVFCALMYRYAATE